jgi:ribonuclease Z
VKITMLGTGAALPDPERGQSAVLVSTNAGKHYLFDCGEGATRQMVRANINPADVGLVFLTHLHHDHISDFPYFVISSWMLNRKGSPILLGPKGTKNFVNHLFEDGAYRADFMARSAYPVRKENIDAVRPDVREIAPGVVFEDSDIRITALHVDHLPHEICECFGVRIEADGKVVAFSGDTKPCAAMVELARDADLLIHECTFPQTFIDHRARSGVGTFSHTSPLGLGLIAAEAKVKSVVATHFGHFDSTSPVLKRAAGKHLPVELMGPHLMEDVVTDIRRNYRGPLRLAHDLMRIDL